MPQIKMNIQTIGLNIHYSQTSHDGCGKNLDSYFHFSFVVYVSDAKVTKTT